MRLEFSVSRILHSLVIISLIYLPKNIIFPKCSMLNSSLLFVIFQKDVFLLIFVLREYFYKV